MPIAKTDQRALDALQKAKSRQEALAAYLDFYTELMQAQFEFKATLSGEPHSAPPAVHRQRLADGLAQLTFEQLGVTAESLASLAIHLWDVMVSYNPEWAAGREAWAPDELLALARQEFETQSPFHAPPATDRKPADVLIRLALAPYLQRAAEALLPLLDLKDWRRGYCPICGGQPHFAALRGEGERWLLCSRCNAEWPSARLECPFCSNTDPSRLAYYPGQDGVYRLYVCHACRRYLKTIDLRLAQDRILSVEPILTIDMDLAARQEGFH